MVYAIHEILQCSATASCAHKRWTADISHDVGDVSPSSIAVLHSCLACAMRLQAGSWSMLLCPHLARLQWACMTRQAVMQPLSSMLCIITAR